MHTTLHIFSIFSLSFYFITYLLFCMSSCIFYNFIYISTIIATFMYIGEMGKLSCKLDFLFSKVSYILLNLEKKNDFFYLNTRKISNSFYSFFLHNICSKNSKLTSTSYDSFIKNIHYPTYYYKKKNLNPLKFF